jgi:nucleotide-binding universal stress UspA family protein
MYNRILVPIDGSDTSNSALKEAVTLAKDQHSTLRLFHVVDLTMTYSAVQAPHMSEHQDALQAEGQKVIVDASTIVRKEAIQCDSKCITTFDKHIYDSIAEEAKRWPADLIVIGTHGRRGVRRLLMGSVAEGLARVASRPVLLVRSE